MRSPLGRLQMESQPDAGSPPARAWRGWLLVAAVVGVTAADTALRDDLVWRLVTVGYGVPMVLALLWRRAQPLVSVTLGVGALVVVDLVSAAAASTPFYPYAGVFVVVLVYSLFRWGTGRQAAIGAVVVLLEWVVSVSSDFTGATDAVGGIAVLLFVATLGVATRYLHVVRTQRLEQVRLHEREALARELHDTVAHHVSAIAIQAQAGGFLADSGDLPGAAEALATIEGEAARTLAEMRAIVGYLRRRDDAGTQRTPHGLADIGDLATSAAPGPRIEIERRGELDDVPPAVQASLYRIAQESISNARRHARHATRIQVRLCGDADSVRLGVTDDGDRVSGPPRPPGYGLTGMAERITLLGGRIDAGPLPGRGWAVQATIPRPEARA